MELAADVSLGSGEQGHDNQGDGGQGDPGQALLGPIAQQQGAGRLGRHPGREQEEGDRDQPYRPSLGPLGDVPAVAFGGQPPQHH